jgi:hypothetical protein
MGRRRDAPRALRPSILGPKDNEVEFLPDTDTSCPQLVCCPLLKGDMPVHEVKPRSGYIDDTQASFDQVLSRRGAKTPNADIEAIQRLGDVPSYLKLGK